MAHILMHRDFKAAQTAPKRTEQGLESSWAAFGKAKREGLGLPKPKRKKPGVRASPLRHRCPDFLDQRAQFQALTDVEIGSENQPPSLSRPIKK
jgi:hypothetical protein